MANYYTEDHEWLETSGEISTVGITAHAAAQLGDVVFLELKEPGTTFAKGEVIGVIESVKAASEIYAPVDGELVEINTAATETPTLVSESPEAGGWLVKIKVANSAQLSDLMSSEAYKQLVGS